jgi:hypothetical protein
VPGGKEVATVISKIASVTIGGIVVGTTTTGDHFEFAAEQIGSFKSVGFTAPLDLAIAHQIFEFSPLTKDGTYPNGDVALHEL